MTLIDAVKTHASKCYYQGWDEVAECCEDWEIAEYIGNATTPAEAIAAVAQVFDLSPVPLTGWIVRIQDTDGRSIESYATLEAAAARYEEMAGRPPKEACYSSTVSDFGTVVTLNAA